MTDGVNFDIEKEYLKCKLSPLYFIENYIKIPVAGGLVTMKESELWNNTRKYRDFVRLATDPNIDNIEILFSRQHGKTTTIAMIILHNMIFYPKLKVQFLTLSKENALDVIERMKFMLDNLPKFLRVKPLGKGDKKTYLELENGSKITTKYVSGNINPDQIGRGFSVPIVWIDEAAFIPHMDIVWAAMQPAISAARVQAKKNNFPTKIFLSTTPNGAGTNWFYNMWKRGWDYEDIFDLENNKALDNAEEILNSDPEKNNFVRVKIHWSETGKTKEWYDRQVKELNFNMRKINQEINLVFLGSAFTVFDDDVLAEFEPASPVRKIDLGFGGVFSLFEDIDDILQENKYEQLILGVDTAVSTAAKSDYSALVLTKASTGEQIGEWRGKISVLKRYAYMLKKLILNLVTLYDLDEDNFRVVIERNSIGLGIIEELIYDETFEYSAYLYKTEIRKGEVAPGLMTRKDTREKMFELLLSWLNENPRRARGPILQEELRNLEQKSNGRIEAGSGQHDDTVMAYNFTLFVRNDLILKGEISPLGGDSKTDTPVKKHSKEKILHSLDIAFSSLSNFEDYEKRKKDYEVIIDTGDEKQRKRKIKQLKEEWSPMIKSREETEDMIGYDILDF